METHLHSIQDASHTTTSMVVNVAPVSSRTDKSPTAPEWVVDIVDEEPFDIPWVGYLRFQRSQPKTLLIGEDVKGR